MDGDFVFKGDHSQESAFKLWDSPPESPTITFLRFDSVWMFQDPYAPFFLEIWPLAQHFFLKIPGIFVFWHKELYALTHKKLKEFLSKILIVLQNGLVDKFIEAADPFQLVFQLGIGEDPFAVPVLGDDDDLFDIVQLLIKLFHYLFDRTLGPGKRNDVFGHICVAG
jgi:hypothetical protein